MRLVLAPMEGVVDYLMRQLLTDNGAFDLCVTEFIRITNTLLPEAVFLRLCPELKHGGHTRSGTPVFIQLLGNDPVTMADNAARAAELGALGIDINFGCPAKTVNRHKGGAALLKEPETLHRIVQSVRQAVPEHIPVTAKMRLGFEDKSLAIENAVAIESAGADTLTIHARTKVEGYRPPAHWEWIAKIREHVSLNIIANGEIWSIDDYQRCQAASGCSDIMIGRGAIAQPLLASRLKSLQDTDSSMPDWLETRALLVQFAQTVLHSPQEYLEHCNIREPGRYLADRCKQWLGMMVRCHDGAASLFQQIKRETCPETIYRTLLT